MKRATVILLLVLSIGSTSTSQTTMYIHKYNGTSDSVRLNEIQSITFRMNAPSTNGVIAFYPLNSDTKDYSGNGYDCVSNGIVPMVDRFGHTGGAMSFSATQSTCTANVASGFAATNLTISLWIKYAGGGTQNPRLFGVSGSQSNAHAYSFILTHSLGTYNRLWFYCEPNSPTYNAFSNATVADDTWKHVVVRYDGVKVSFFINGALDNQELKTIPIQAISSGYLTLGHSIIGTTPYDRFEGGLDDVRFYNRALSDEEVQALYHEGGYTGL